MTPKRANCSMPIPEWLQLSFLPSDPDVKALVCGKCHYSLYSPSNNIRINGFLRKINLTQQLFFYNYITAQYSFFIIFKEFVQTLLTTTPVAALLASLAVTVISLLQHAPLISVFQT